MKTQSFSIRKAVKYGWKTTTSQLRFFIPLILVIYSVSFAPQILLRMVSKGNILPFLVFIVLASTVLSLLFSIGTIKISLDFVHGRQEKAHILDLFTQYKFLINFIVAGILYIVPIYFVMGVGALGVFGAFLVRNETLSILIPVVTVVIAIVVTVWWLARMQFYSYFIVDKKAGPIQALKQSYHATKGKVWKLIGLYFVLLGINLLGIAVLFVGLIVTTPLSWLTMAYIYKEISPKAS